jgi:hypothetical protein
MVAVRNYEMVVEVNYGLPIGHRHFRPLAQWYIHPVAGAPDDAAGRSLRNAALVACILMPPSNEQMKALRQSLLNYSSSTWLGV